MKTVYIDRTERSDQGTFGHLICEALHLHSGELPWMNNEPNVSCIPTGTYTVKWIPTGNYKGYVIQDVPGRTDIEFHIGNWCGDVFRWKSSVLGCVCLGLKRGRMRPHGYNFLQEAVISSKNAMRKFHAFMKKETFILIIEDKFNEEGVS